MCSIVNPEIFLNAENNMRRYFLLFLGICALSNISLGQTNSFSGIVLDNNSKLPIQYVNIGIEGKDIGTVSDSAGFFSLCISQENLSETVVFSIIGYEPFRMSINDLKKSDGRVYLNQGNVELNEIVIRPDKRQSTELGIKGLGYLCVGFNNAEKGYEIGSMLHSDSKSLLTGCKISFVQKIITPGYKFRLNVYSIKDGVFTNILGEMIIAGSEDLVKLDKGSYFIDLKKYGIVVDGDFLIAIEKIEEKADLFLHAKSSGPKSFYRKTSLGSWNVSRYSVGIRVLTQEI